MPGISSFEFDLWDGKCITDLFEGPAGPGLKIGGPETRVRLLAVLLAVVAHPAALPFDRGRCLPDSLDGEILRVNGFDLDGHILFARARQRHSSRRQRDKSSEALDLFV